MFQVAIFLELSKNKTRKVVGTLATALHKPYFLSCKYETANMRAMRTLPNIDTESKFSADIKQMLKAFSSLPTQQVLH